MDAETVLMIRTLEVVEKLMDCDYECERDRKIIFKRLIVGWYMARRDP